MPVKIIGEDHWQGVSLAKMPIEIACGNCENSFGVEAEWAGMIVQCPFCQIAVQVPDEVASYADPPPSEKPTKDVRAVEPDLADTQPVPMLDLIPPQPRSKESLPQKVTSEKFGPKETTTKPSVPQESIQKKPTRTEPNPKESPPKTLSPQVPKPQDTKPPDQKPQVPKPHVPKPPVPKPQEPTPQEPTPQEPSTVAPVAEPPTAAALEPTAPPLPDWTVPPTCHWLLETSAAQDVRVTVRQGTTTINYQGRKLVLRDQPEAANWYGRVAFGMSVLTLVLLLTWFYYIFR
jgi:hypothetical protein